MRQEDYLPILGVPGVPGVPCQTPHCRPSHRHWWPPDWILRGVRVFWRQQQEPSQALFSKTTHYSNILEPVSDRFCFHFVGGKSDQTSAGCNAFNMHEENSSIAFNCYDLVWLPPGDILRSKIERS